MVPSRARYKTSNLLKPVVLFSYEAPAEHLTVLHHSPGPVTIGTLLACVHSYHLACVHSYHLACVHSYHLACVHSYLSLRLG